MNDIDSLLSYIPHEKKVSHLFDGKDKLLFLNHVLHPEPVPLLLLLLKKVPKRPLSAQRLRRQDLLNASQALRGVLLKQVCLPVHQIVLETFRRFGLHRKEVLPPLFDLLPDVQELFNVIHGLVRRRGGGRRCG